MRNKVASLFALLAGLLVCTPSGATLYQLDGTFCREANDATPDLVYSPVNGTARNSGTAVERFVCSAPNEPAKTLREARVHVFDQHPTKAVECTACNGSFCASGASAGASGTTKIITLDVADAAWTDATVSCLVPEISGTSNSSVNFLRFETN